MANPEHVELVKKGAVAIAEWMEANPKVDLRLQEASLSGLDLKGADLRAANLRDASLQDADLRRANLVGADLRGASLDHADLRGADLQGAYLGDACLRGADLRLADLGESNLRRANLRGANLIGAILTGALLHNADLGDAQLHKARMCGVRGVVSAYPAKLDGIRGQETVRLSRAWGVGWESIRSVGALPLFGVSYFALIAIWIWAVTVRFYNAQIAAVRAWASKHVEDTDPQQWLASLILKINKVDLSGSLGASFTAVLLLAAAATVYKIACPGEIQENSRQRWVHQLGKPLLHYRFLARVGVVWRWITAVLYAVAIPWVLWVVAQRIWETYEIFLAE